MQYIVQYLDKITNVGNFFIMDSELYCFHTDGSIEKFQGRASVWKNNFNTQYFVAKFNLQFFCTWRDYNKILFFDCESGIILKEKKIDQFRILKIENESILGLHYTSLDNKYQFSVGKLNKSFEFKILFDTGEAAPMQFLDKFLLCTKHQNLLIGYLLATGEALWQLDFEVLLGRAGAAVYGDMFDHEGRLFFFLSDVQAGIGATFCVSLETGTVLQKIEHFKGSLQLVNGLLYALGINNIQILNPNTFELKKIDCSPILEPKAWRFTWNKYVIKDNKLYFIHQQTKGGGKAIIGTIEIKTCKLLWHTEILIEKGKYWIAEIKVNENKLYILTQGGTLYIYELTSF
ncbi:MAG: hypothetical protein RLZZ628_1505 [Bacteroidota bacterium]|jgi:hypothetical protein